MKVLPINTATGYFYNCVGCSANTPEELGQKINDMLNEIGDLNAQVELMDVKYKVSSPKEGVLIFSAQIIFKAKQKIEM